MKKKQWILLGIWYLAYMTTLQFFRFKFGLFEISAAYLFIGIPVVLFFGRHKPKSDENNAGGLGESKNPQKPQ